MVVFPVVILGFEDQRGVPLKFLPVLRKIHGSSLMPSSHNCFRLWEFFSPIRSNSGDFSVWFSEGHHFGFIHSQLSALVLDFSGASLKYSLVSSWSLRSLVSKFSQVSSFIFKFFPGVSLSFLRSFSILTVVFSRFYSMVIILIHSLFQSDRWFIEDFLKFTLYLP